jgi:LPXTG-motif cell wall-anchored protein
MKKAISLLLVLIVTLSISVVGFAATDIPATYGGPTLFAATVTPPASPSTTATYTIPKGELFLVNSNKIRGTESELRPNESYTFDIYYAANAISGKTEDEILKATPPLASKLTKADIGAGTVKLRTVKGSSAVSSAKVKTSGSGTAQTYRLEIDTRANYGVKTIDLEYTLNVINTDTANTFAESTHTFTVGFNTVSDAEVDVGEGGTITISNEAPVILKDQFSDMAKSANYKNVIFEADDGNWSFTGKVAGMKDTNFTFNYDPDTDLLNKFPENDFKFLNFPAGVNFPTTGEMRIDVSDVTDSFRTMYAYLYRDGKLTQINGTYNSATDELVFRTNYLGKFIITDIAITDTSLIPEENVPEENIIENRPGTNNPATGAANSANAFVALGLIALASAAAVSTKRK